MLPGSASSMICFSFRLLSFALAPFSRSFWGFFFFPPLLFSALRDVDGVHVVGEPSTVPE